MSKFYITRTTCPLPDERGLEGARRFLFGVFDGLGDDARKAWRRLWKRMMSLTPGELAEIEIVIPRNPKFHRKFFALLKIGYEAWEPQILHDGQRIEKSFDQFREDVTIMAGHYIQTWTLDGEMRLRAKSISFAAMDDSEFEQVYGSVADVILTKVLTGYRDREELDRVFEHIVRML